MGKRQFFSYLIVFMATSALSLKLFATTVSAADFRVQKLANFLASQNSPLAYYAPDFVYYADLNGLDYRLLPAISGVESTFAKQYIYGSYNAYGWGGGLIYFSSWPDSIAKISAHLRTDYVNRGAHTVEQIGYIYCPPNALHWAGNARYFMGLIENTPITSYLVSGPLTLGYTQLPLTI